MYCLMSIPGSHHAKEAFSYNSHKFDTCGHTGDIVSRDSRLEEMMAAGQEVEVRVFNPLTNLRSSPVSFSRSNR